MIRGFYTVEEASQLSGLKINTLKQYSSSARSTLVRGRDFTTLRRYRFGRTQHKIVFTKQGIERLIARDFHVIKPADRKTPPRERNIITRLYREANGINLASPRTIEGKLRRKQLRIVRLAVHLYNNPCVSVGCLCQCHSLIDGEYSVITDAKASTVEPEVTFVAGKKDEK